MPLIARLTLRLVAVTLLCLIAACAFTMVSAHRAIEAETAASAERVAHALENLYWRQILWRQTLRHDKLLPVPEWRTLETLTQISPGVCVTFAPARETPASLCSQLDGLGGPAPSWFQDAYVRLFGAPAAVTRALAAREAESGFVVASADARAAVRQAWRQISVVVGVAATMALAIALLSALAIAEALSPTQIVVDGLRRLEREDYAHRIRASLKGEFGLIARAANDLAARLQQTRAERAALTKRLFEVQEEERRALARDLHDEFGQCLTATLAYAAAIESSARERADLAEDARAISNAARRMMTTLREALTRLRSQDVDELGLEASLRQLAASWNARGATRSVVRLDLAGDLAGVPQTVAVNLLRIAQECVTNAMRHGAPSDVSLRVACGAADVALSVEDDGGGDPERLRLSSGHGVIGLRERVAALSGSLEIGCAARGVRVAARIPLRLAA
ncbi:MAG TPA: histidine kinase [Methylocystis sp.]|nr:histidine kinase [Methylocystis sp.]